MLYLREHGGWDEVVLYLDHGVNYPRHRDIHSEAWLGAMFLDTALTPRSPRSRRTGLPNRSG